MVTMVINPNIQAGYTLEEQTDIYILIKDLNVGRSITNDAENVVEDVHNRYNLKGRILFYIDTTGCVDILEHDDNGKFTQFSFGYDSKEDFDKHKSGISRL
jgi:hypothetical protein